MAGLDAKLKEALIAYDREGRFGEADYQVLRAVLAGALGRRASGGDLLDGLANLFFERNLMNDARRTELLTLDDDAFGRALRHRFRQLVADEHDEHRPYHALRAHVRDAIAALPEKASKAAAWPASLRGGAGFSAASVEQAVRALWADGGKKPEVAAATAELFSRYVRPDGPPTPSASHQVPDALCRRVDAQRLAAGILQLLDEDEKDLLRHVIADEGSVEEWAAAKGCSRATAYRLMARLKALCKVEFSQRSSGTRIEVLNALSQRLSED